MTKKPTIREIKTYLARHGAKLTLSKMTLNNRRAYTVLFPDYRITTYTDLGLIDAYLNGSLIGGSHE